MGRLLVLLFFVNVALIAVALIDCLSSESGEVRALPKAAWVLIILLLPAVGPGIWFASGRPHGPEATDPVGSGPAVSGSVQGSMRKTSRPLAPDDDPEFLRNLAATTRKADEDRLRAWEDDLHKREEELRRRLHKDDPRNDLPGERSPEDPRS